MMDTFTNRFNLFGICRVMWSARRCTPVWHASPKRPRTRRNGPVFVLRALTSVMTVMNWLNCTPNAIFVAIVEHRKFCQFAANWIRINPRTTNSTLTIRIFRAFIAHAIAHIRIPMTPLRMKWFSAFYAKIGTIFGIWKLRCRMSIHSMRSYVRIARNCIASFSITASTRLRQWQSRAPIKA